MMVGRLSTDVEAIDDLLDGGLARGEVTAIASRPGMGKTMGLLSIAVKAGVDSVLYAPSLSYPDAKDRVAKICQGLGSAGEATYDLTPGLWLSIQLPDHKMLVAGRAARAVANGKTMLANMEAMLETGSASIVMLDAPCKKMKAREEKEFMGQLAKIARRYCAPVVVSTMLRLDPAVSSPTISDVNETVADVAADVIWMSGWPKIVRGDEKFTVGVLSDDDHDGEWESRTTELTLHGTVGSRQQLTIGYKRQ